MPGGCRAAEKYEVLAPMGRKEREMDWRDELESVLESEEEMEIRRLAWEEEDDRGKEAIWLE